MDLQGLKIPRFMIAGTHSGVGKTTITTAIMAALTQKGLNVQPFKVGPDYIDPTYHSTATGNKCRNLDTWMLDEQTVCRLFANSAAKADMAVIEGVMGVFDGSAATSDNGSSAHIAKLLGCPVILIVDVKSMARSAAAVILGYKNFDPKLNIAGVILNRIGSDRHLSLVREAIETYCNVPVIGYIRKNAKLELPSRHLGLIPTVEGGQLLDTIGLLAEEVREGLDIEKLIIIANTAECFNARIEDEICIDDNIFSVRIGIALDEAFSFYYRDGLDVLEKYGAELVFFSPLHDQKLPQGLDGIYIGGGFPEIYIKELAKNKTFMEDLRMAGDNGMPVFAECGGYMYLARSIVDTGGQRHDTVGLIPGECIMSKKLVGMGYAEAESLTDNILGKKGKKARGHEFHYSKFKPLEQDYPFAFRLVRNCYRDTVLDGYANGNILASYMHLHFAADPELAVNFLNICREYQKSRCGKVEHGNNQ
jgi:cobyrinic acid a,c-diamide synthase